MGAPVFSTAVEICMQAYENTPISTALYSPKVWERFFDDIYSLLKRTHLKKLFYHISNIYQNIKFTIKEKRKKELAFLQTLLKQKNGKIYRNSTHTDHQTVCKEIVVSYLFKRTSSIIADKDYCYE